MGWWSGNRKSVNRRAEARFKEAKNLVSETVDIAGESRDLKSEYLEEGHRRAMATNLRGVLDSRDALRRQEKRAMDRVAEITNNPLATLRARQDLMSDDEVREIYGTYADERVDIYGQKKGAELGIETSYMQNLAQSKSEMASLMMQFREEVDPGMGGSVMGAIGSVVGGWIGCWVAREAYGANNPRWLLFRQWLIEDSPRWFLSLYMKHGERFAKFISNKPWLKAIIRRWMDRKIASRMIKVLS